MFEQSLILEQGTKKPWNFVASFGMQLFVVSVALLIPLIFRDQLPNVHWMDIVVAPPVSAPPLPVQPAQSSGSTASVRSAAAHRPFVWNPRAMVQSPSSAVMDFTPDAPPNVGVPDSIGGRTNNTFIPNIVALPPPPPPKPTVQNPPAGPLRVTSELQMAKVLRKVIPEYPALARSARISGVVRLIGIIGKDGTIQNLQLVSGHPLLAHAALEAVRQWVYKPTLLDGKPVEVIAPIEVNFTLGQ